MSVCLSVCGVVGWCVCARAHPAMLLVEMLLERLLCVLKDRMLGFLRGKDWGAWSSVLGSVDQRSRVREADEDEDNDEAEEEAG